MVKRRKKTLQPLGPVDLLTIEFAWILIGRSGGIWTHDPYTPSIVRYQAALHSDASLQYTTAKQGRKQNSANIIFANITNDQTVPIIFSLSC